jgi:large repetitive protein
LIMSYDDLSQGVASSDVTVARADVDGLPPGMMGPALGNTITGNDTITGEAGADSVANPPGVVVAVQGAGGAAAGANGSFVVAGQYGVLTIQADGSYSYVRNAGSPDGVDDVFTYTLADQSGQQSSSTLTIELGADLPSDAATAAFQPGVVTLPPGVDVSDIRVVGRDLVIDLPDGTQMIIPGGAVFVPQLVIGDVEVPASNLAALLIDSEPQPAAGSPLSSGGNFAVDVPPLDPGVPLGDLLPPTELVFTPPEFEEVGQAIDREPTIFIVTPNNPAGAVNATDAVDESGLPARGSEPEGTLEPQNIETTSGTIVFTAEDGLASVTINGVEVTAVGQQIEGEQGILTITSINLVTGEIGYSYTVTDNTTDGLDDFDDFTVVVTDSDGDTATATLHIDIADDEPIARDDTDAVDIQTNIAAGNVMTGIDTTSGSAGADTVGADDAQLTAVSGAGGSDDTFDSDGNLIVEGEYGTLTIDAEGNYTYVLSEDAPGGSVDEFVYTLTDGDGDTVTATLTITNPDTQPEVGANAAVQLDDDALPGGNPGGVGDDPDAVNTTGTLSGSGGDGALTFALLATGAPAGFTYVLQANGDLWVMQGSTHVLSVSVDSATGDYTVTQVNPIDHPPGSNENNVVFTINYTVTDVDGDTANGTLDINVDDDTPLANDDTDSVNLQTGSATGNVITGVGTNEGAGNADSPGADGFGGVTGIASNNVPANTDTSADGSGDYVVQGQYGELTLNEDGSYTYVANENAPGGGTDVFTYTYVDGDGDTVSATLTITNPDTQPVVPENVNVGLDDDALAGGNPGGVGDDPDAVNTSGSVAATGGDGTITYALSDTGAPAGFTYQLQGNGDLWVMQGSTHVLTVTLDASGNYTVSQVNPIDHPPGNDENNVTFTVTFSATDADGDSDSGTFTISVDDDTPLATDDTDSIASGDFGPATGNVIDNDSPGADGFGAVVGVAAGDTGTPLDNPATVGVAISGTYGELTLNDDGSYSYTRDPGTPGGVEDVFTYTYVDGDGDTVTATLTISIGDATPTANAPALVIVDDDDVGSDGNPGGTGDDDPQNETGTLTATGGDGDIDFFFDVAETEAGLPAGFSLDPASTQTNLLIMQGTTLVMTVTLDSETGDYTVTQNAPVAHAPGDDENNTEFAIEFYAQDEDGSQSANQTLSISVDDDTPLATDDTDSIASGDFGPATGNVIDNDSPGADGFGAVVGVAAGDTGTPLDNPATVGVAISGTYGELTLNDDGSYSYTRDPGTPGGVEDVFTYTYVDGDGDTVTATLTISIGDATPTANAPALVIVDDDDVGSDGNPGGTGDDDPQNETGTLTATGGDGDIDFFFDVAETEAGLPAGFSLDPASTQTNLLIMQGTTLVMTVTLDSETGDYTVTQNAPVAHAPGDDENNTEFAIEFYAQDEDGSQSANQTLSISVDDDTPISFTPVALTDTDGSTPIAQDDALVNDGTANVTRLINDSDNDGTGENFIGADGFGSLTFTSTGHIDGELLEDAFGNPLTSGGDPVYLFGFGTDTLIASTDPDYPDNENPDTVVFTASLDEGTGSGADAMYTLDFNAVIDNGAGVEFNNLTSADAGNTDYVGIGVDDPATEVDIILSARSENGTQGTINTNATSIGVDSQSIGPGAAVRIDFVSNLETGASPTGFTYDGHVTTTIFEQTIAQVNGNPNNTIDITVSAILADDDQEFDNTPTTPEDGESLADIHTVTIQNYSNTNPPVLLDTYTFVEGDPPPAASPYTVTFNGDGSVTIEGLGEHDVYEIETSDPFSAVVVEASPANTTDFDLGIFAIGSVNTGDPVDLSFDVTAADADGDTSTGTIDVTLVPADSTTTTTLSTESTLSTQSLESSSLLVSNDNQETQKSSSGGNNAVLFGAVAAAGLAAQSAAARTDIKGSDELSLAQSTSDTSEPSISSQSGMVESNAQLITGEAKESLPEESATASGAPSPDDVQSLNVGKPADSPSDSASELSEGTEAPSGQTSAPTITADSVMMPAAEMVAASNEDGIEAAQHNQVVGKVLADALAGGGNESDIDAALSQLQGQSEPGAALAQLASPDAADVPAWHSAGMAAFNFSGSVFSMETVMLHQDAAPTAQG